MALFYSIWIWGGILVEPLSIYHVFATLIGSWGQLGVDLFVIISVYFLRKSNRFKSHKALDLLAVSVFYGLFWTAICIIFGIPVSNSEFLRGTFATFTGGNWFAFSYLLLYLLHPILNMILKKLSICELKKCTILITIIVSGLKTIYHGIPICDFMFMINIYLIIDYVERSGFKTTLIQYSLKGAFFISCMLVILHIILVYIGDLLDSSFIRIHSYYMNLRGSIFILIDAVLIFYGVTTLKPKYSKTVNRIASTCFGVFLSHQLIGYKFWYYILYKTTSNQIYSCIHMLISIVVIFVSCSLIDIIRQHTIGMVTKRILCCKRINAKLTLFDTYINSSP